MKEIIQCAHHLWTKTEIIEYQCVDNDCQEWGVRQKQCSENQNMNIMTDGQIRIALIHVQLESLRKEII